MDRKPTLAERLQYSVDNFLARGSGALFWSLLLAVLSTLVALALLRLVFGLISPAGAKSFWQGLWVVFLELTDPGAMSEDNDTPPIFKIAAVLAGMSGMLMFSALIAFSMTALERAIESLKRGHSRVLERGHTLIVGFGPRVFEVIKELIEAKESERKPVIVLLTERDKEEVDEQLMKVLPPRREVRRNTRIVTRAGGTSSLLSLEKVSAHAARNAIVLATQGAASSEKAKQLSDAKVIKSILALRTHVGDAHPLTIVAEIYDQRNREVVQQIDAERISVLNAEDILAKIMVQTSRTSGLAVVYSELLSFAGSEMYFFKAPFAGAKFGDLLYRFEDGVPIGIRDAQGQLEIRPPADRVLQDGESLILVAEDDSTIALESGPVCTPAPASPKLERLELNAERQLILGWSPKGLIIVSEYANYVLPGSEVDVVVPEPSVQVVEELQALDRALSSVRVRCVDADPLSAQALEVLDPFSYDNVIILPQSPEAGADAERIDAETLIVLLHLRKLAPDGPSKTKIITEVVDSANRELISRAGVDDFIISNRMVSMLLAQISEQPEIQAVYEELFEESGSEIYLKPAHLYFESLPVRRPFADLMAAALARDGEICLGYKLAAHDHDPEQNFGVHLVPPKRQEITLGPEDALVVVAEDER